MKDVTELQAWKTGIELVKEIYLLTKSFPREELYGLTSQIKKSSESILANIAEGFGRYTYADKANKYVIARGECSETFAHLSVAVALQFLPSNKASQAFDLLLLEKKLLSGLVAACKERS